MQTLNKGNKLNANQSLMQKNCMLEKMPNQKFFFNFFSCPSIMKNVLNMDEILYIC
jgi:hypothetical protein